jgi:hypothetical protein
VPTTPASRARLTTAAAAVAVAAGLGVDILRSHGALRPGAVLLVGLAAAVMLLGLAFAWPSTGAIASVVLGAAYVTTLHGHGPRLDGRAPLVGAALLLLAELIAWSAETTTSGLPVRSDTRRLPRVAVLAATTAVAWAAGEALVAVVTLPFGSDLALTAAGATTVAAVVALLLGLAERRAADDR